MVDTVFYENGFTRKPAWQRFIETVPRPFVLVQESETLHSRCPVPADIHSTATTSPTSRRHLWSGRFKRSSFSVCVKYLGRGQDTSTSVWAVPVSVSWRACRWRGRWRILLCSSPSFPNTCSGNFCQDKMNHQVIGNESKEARPCRKITGRLNTGNKTTSLRPNMRGEVNYTEQDIIMAPVMKLKTPNICIFVPRLSTVTFLVKLGLMVWIFLKHLSKFLGKKNVIFPGKEGWEPHCWSGWPRWGTGLKHEHVPAHTRCTSCMDDVHTQVLA